MRSELSWGLEGVAQTCLLSFLLFSFIFFLMLDQRSYGINELLTYFHVTTGMFANFACNVDNDAVLYLEPTSQKEHFPSHKAQP